MSVQYSLNWNKNAANKNEVYKSYKGMTTPVSYVSFDNHHIIGKMGIKYPKIAFYSVIYHVRNRDIFNNNTMMRAQHNTDNSIVDPRD